MKDLIDRNLHRMTWAVVSLAVVAGLLVHVVNSEPVQSQGYSHEFLLQCPEYYCTFRCYSSEMDRYVNQYDELPDTGIEQLAQGIMEGCQKVHHNEPCLQKFQADSSDLQAIYSGRVRVSDSPLCPMGAMIQATVKEL